jgi:DNA polymerase-3 subunit epsilon/oligoribonuclease
MLGVFLDTEANGLNPQVHKIIEVAFKIADLASGEIKEIYQSLVRVSFEAWEKSDPASLHINGFSWEEVKAAPTPSQVAEEIIDLLTRHGIKRKKAVFICQNPSFDRVYFSQLVNVDTQELLQFPYHWLDLASMFWAITLRIEKLMPWDIGFSKDLIASYYHLPGEEKPHRAMNGVNHLFLCYEKAVGFPEREG